MITIEVVTQFLMSWLILPLLALSIVVTFIRFVKGPSLPDRIVAVDILSGIAVGTMAVYSISTGEAVFLDVALVIALISFLGTIGFAYYIDRRQ